jgi:uncharacterized protein YjbJ (UPF0337 family)
MNTDQLSGKWKQMKGAAKQHWGKLTDDDLEVIAGKREALAGKLQERYGMAKEEAQKKADEWLKTNNLVEEQTAFGRSHQEAGREQHSASKR